MTDNNLHEALFCEKKHKKLLVRFELGKHSYVDFNIVQDRDEQTYADIIISGDPNTFRVPIEKKDSKWFIQPEARINYEYTLRG